MRRSCQFLCVLSLALLSSVEARDFVTGGSTKRATYDLTWPLQRVGQALPAGAFQLAGGGEDQLTIELTGRSWRLLRSDTDAAELASGACPDLTGETSIVVKRRAYYVSVYLAGQLLCRVWTPGSGAGVYGHWSDGSLAIAMPTLQAVPAAGVVFNDDFMRLPDVQEAGAWTLVSGTWKLQSTADKWRGDSPLDPMNSSRSANPFVYRGSDDGLAVAVTGHLFWDDLATAVSVRSQGGKAGLIYGWQSAQDYYVLCWEPTGKWPGPARFALERVRGDEHRTLAETWVTGQREQWYRLGLEQHGAALRATLQGSPLLVAMDDTCRGGNIGMCASGGSVDFDDYVAQPAPIRPPLDGAQLELPGLQASRVSLTVGPGTQPVDFTFATAGAPVQLQCQPDASAPLRLIAEQAPTGLVFRERDRGSLQRLPGAAFAKDLQLSWTGSEAQVSDVIVDGPDERDWQQPVETGLFVVDHYMTEWAAPEGQWALTGHDQNGLWWQHKSDSYGLVTLDLPLAAARKPSGLRVQFGDWLFSLIPDAQQLRARLTHGDAVLADQLVSPPSDCPSLSLQRDGNQAWLLAGNAELLQMAWPPAQAPGPQLRLQLVDPTMLTAVTLQRDKVLDYQFDHVAVDWRKLGRWEISNKFACDPRWSFMVGESTGLAALWHRDRFPGDLTLEFYAGMRYYGGGPPYYHRPGDINAVLSVSGESVYDGYTFVISGWDTSWTRILRNGVVVAESDTPLVPATHWTYPRMRELHRRWFYVKVRRVGSLLELYVDNKLILSWSDPQPLDAERVGLWTVDNGIVIARTQIAYRHRQRDLPPLVQAPKPPAATPLPPASPVLLSTSHPGRCLTLDSPADLAAWHPEDHDDGDARVTFCDRGQRGGALHATNVFSGGRFRVQVPFAPLELRRAAGLSFACRLPPESKINLYLRLSGQDYVLQLTGPPDNFEHLRQLGKLPVIADGQWHTYTLPLDKSLTTLAPSGASLQLESMYFGLRKGYYLLAGEGGNPAGAWYDLDEVTVWSAGGRQLVVSSDVGGTFEILAADGSSVVSEKSFTDVISQTLAEPGSYRLQTRAADGRVAVLPFEVRLPLAVAAVTPAPDDAWGGEDITIRFADGTDVPFWELALAVGERVFAPQAPELLWAPGAHTLVLQTNTLAGTGVLDALDTIPLRLFHESAPHEPLYDWQVAFDARRDQRPPALVRLTQALIADDFEDGLDTWQSHGTGGALVERDDSTAAGGRYSLRLTNRGWGGTAGASRPFTPFKAGRCPLLSFAVRMVDETIMNLALRAGGEDWRLALTDTYCFNTSRLLQQLAPFAPDGNWYRFEVNLQQLLAAQPYGPNHYSIQSLRFEDLGWLSNRDGARTWVDEIRVSPCLSSTGLGCELSWTSADLSGIAGFSYAWDAAPDTVSEGPQGTARFQNLSEGRHTFRVRAQDKAGNWNEATDWTVLIDNTPPALLAYAPRDRSGADTVRVQLTDNLSGIDPDSVVLQINGQAQRPGGPGVSFDLAAGVLQVDLAAAQLTNGQPSQVFEVLLAPLQDFAGNASESFTWSWSYSRELDQRAPSTPVIEWVGGQVDKHLHLEDRDGRLEVGGALTDRVFDPELGGHVQRCRIHYDSSDAWVRINSASFDTAVQRYLTFRYRWPPGLKLDLSAAVTDPDPERRRMVVKLTDGAVRPDYVTRAGYVPGIRTDDRWHAAVVDLKAHVAEREHLPAGEEITNWHISDLRLADCGWNWAPRGTVFFLDDVQLQAAGTPDARFKFSDTDIAGIAGYAWAVDREPFGTAPTEIMVQPGAEATVSFAGPGVWYMHARAVDQAGNWSAAGHFAYIVPE